MHAGSAASWLKTTAGLHAVDSDQMARARLKCGRILTSYRGGDHG